MTVRRALLRAVDAYRLMTLGYIVILVAADHHQYRRPTLGWVLLGVMAAWTVVATLGYPRLARRAIPVLSPPRPSPMTVSALPHCVWEIPESWPCSPPPSGSSI